MTSHNSADNGSHCWSLQRRRNTETRKVTCLCRRQTDVWRDEMLTGLNTASCQLSAWLAAVSTVAVVQQLQCADRRTNSYNQTDRHTQYCLHVSSQPFHVQYKLPQLDKVEMQFHLCEVRYIYYIYYITYSNFTIVSSITTGQTVTGASNYHHVIHR